MLNTSPIDSQPLTVFRNADFQKTITVKKDGVAVDITGYTVECKIRDASGSSFVPGNVITATGAILVAASGTLTISLTDVQTATLTSTDSDWFSPSDLPSYDVVLIDGSDLRAVVAGGPVTIEEAITY